MDTDTVDAVATWNISRAHAQRWAERYRNRKLSAGFNVDPSPTSQAVYWRRFLRMNDDSARTGLSVAACAACGVGQNEWYLRRAAYFWCAFKELTRLLECIGEAQAPSSRVGLEHGIAYSGLHAQIQTLLTGCESFERMAAPNRKHRYSTRSHIIRGLPRDWREQLFAQLPAPQRTAFLVLALTGCRPIELQKGVGVTLAEQGGRDLFLFEIEGAKVTPNSGQPQRQLWREIHLCPLASLLYNRLSDVLDGPSPLTPIRVSVECGRSISDAITRYGAKLWPQHGRLNAYALRYQFKEDLCLAGRDRDFIARAMGHNNDVSQNYYGPRRRSNSTNSTSDAHPDAGFVSAQASRVVRHRLFRSRELVLELSYGWWTKERELTPDF